MTPSDADTPLTPRTKAGKALLEREAYNSRSFTLISAEAVVAIEEEAATLDAARPSPAPTEGLRELVASVTDRHQEQRKPTMEPDPCNPLSMRQTAYCQWCATHRPDEDPRWPCETARLLAALRAVDHRPDVEGDHPMANQVRSPLLDLPDHPTEEDRIATYEAALASGLSDAEAREEGWPTCTCKMPFLIHLEHAPHCPLAADNPTPEPARDVVRPIVADWFDTGYENGKLDADVLTDHILAALALPGEALRTALAAALDIDCGVEDVMLRRLPDSNCCDEHNKVRAVIAALPATMETPEDTCTHGRSAHDDIIGCRHCACRIAYRGGLVATTETTGHA